jgi:hypothetical protein
MKVSQRVHRGLVGPLVALALAVAFPPPTTAGDRPAGSDAWDFVTRDGTHLRDGEGVLRFVSFNVPNLLIVEDAFAWGGSTPWRWPDDFELSDAFQTVRQMGGRVARSYVITVRRDDSDMGPFVHVTGPGEFNEEAFVAMDRMLAAANRERIRVIVPLVDNWKWQGGAPQYAAFRGKPPEAFWTDPEVITDFKKTIAHVLRRINTITGIRYADDPTILGWETGNELDSPREWTQEIARTIKHLDANHLVIDGNSLHGVPAAALEIPEIDVITTHHYPGPGVDMAADVATAIAVTAGRKPYFVGEAGFVPLAEIRPIVERVIDSDAAGVLLWSLRFRSRDGGFYWHSEPANQGRYKAFHWPGFPSGEAYEERALLAFTRDTAFRIRGLDPPPPPVPTPPEMLPVNDPAAISWRGSVGATRYVVSRAAAAEGPWEVVTASGRDEATQYRPLFVDEAATPATPWWYRVSAVNGSGTSVPSAAAGPAIANHRVIADELDDLSRTAERSDHVAIETAHARPCREDASRAVMPPGATLVYRPGGPIDSVRVFAFAEDEAGHLFVHAGQKVGPATSVVTRRTVAGGKGGDYGYLLPLEFEATFTGSRPNALTLQTGEAPLRISRVEIRYQAPP